MLSLHASLSLPCYLLLLAAASTPATRRVIAHSVGIAHRFSEPRPGATTKEGEADPA